MLARSLLTIRPEQQYTPVSSCLLKRTNQGSLARLVAEALRHFWISSTPEAAVSPNLVPAFSAEQQHGR